MNSLTSPMMCVIEGDNIIHISTPGQPGKVIGIVYTKYDEAVKIANGYYDQLVKEGIIKPPQTPEERHKELMEAIGGMKNEISVLKGDFSKLSLRTQKLEERRNGNQPGNNRPNS